MARARAAIDDIPPERESGVVEKPRGLRPDDAYEVRAFYLDSGSITRLHCNLGTWIANGGIWLGGAADGRDNDERLDEFSRVSRTLLRCGPAVALVLRHRYAVESALTVLQRIDLCEVKDEYAGVMILAPELEAAWRNGISIDGGALQTLRRLWKARIEVRTSALFERVRHRAQTMLTEAARTYEQNTDAAVRLREFEQHLK